MHFVNRIRPGWTVCVAGAALVLLLAAPVRPATALGVADTAPVAFLPNGGGLGLVEAGQPDGWDAATAGLGVTWTYDHTDLQLSAGNAALFPGVDLAITQDLFAVHQNPQDATNPAPQIATAAAPFIADSRWTVTNASGDPLDGVVLAFVIPHYAAYPNAVQVALDGNGIELIEYTTASQSRLLLGAVHLGDLAAGESTDVVVRYVIAGELQEQTSGDHTDYIMPPLMVTGFTGATPVPEPGAAFLFAVGLGLMARCTRRR